MQLKPDGKWAAQDSHRRVLKVKKRVIERWRQRRQYLSLIDAWIALNCTEQRVQKSGARAAVLLAACQAPICHSEPRCYPQDAPGIMRVLYQRTSPQKWRAFASGRWENLSTIISSRIHRTYEALISCNILQCQSCFAWWVGGEKEENGS